MGAGQAAATLGRQPGRNVGDGVGQRLDRAGRGLAVVDLLQEGAINTQPELSTVRGTYRAGGGIAVSQQADGPPGGCDWTGLSRA